MFFWDAPRIAADIGSRMVPPRWSYLEKLWIPIWDTLNIATLGTIFALILAVPVAFLAAMFSALGKRSQVAQRLGHFQLAEAIFRAGDRKVFGILGSDHYESA